VKTARLELLFMTPFMGQSGGGPQEEEEKLVNMCELVARYKNLPEVC
jgi:hypothetical protein